MKSILAILLVSLSLFASPSGAQSSFTLAEYLAAKKQNTADTEFILQVMGEMVFYAQESAGGAVICATPAPIPGAHLAKMVELELENPSNIRGRPYTKNDPLAFVLMHAMKQHGICR